MRSSLHQHIFLDLRFNYCNYVFIYIQWDIIEKSHNELMQHLLGLPEGTFSYTTLILSCHSSKEGPTQKEMIIKKRQKMKVETKRLDNS